jgi:acyl carrier protein
MDEAREKLRDFVAELMEEVGERGRVGDEDSLVTSGLLDSLAVIQIVTFIEKEFQVDFSTVFFDQGDFDSIDGIIRFLEENAGTDRGGKEE